MLMLTLKTGLALYWYMSLVSRFNDLYGTIGMAAVAVSCLPGTVMVCAIFCARELTEAGLIPEATAEGRE